MDDRVVHGLWACLAHRKVTVKSQIVMISVLLNWCLLEGASAISSRLLDVGQCH